MTLSNFWDDILKVFTPPEEPEYCTVFFEIDGNLIKHIFREEDMKITAKE